MMQLHKATTFWGILLIAILGEVVHVDSMLPRMQSIIRTRVLRQKRTKTSTKEDLARVLRAKPRIEPSNVESEKNETIDGLKRSKRIVSGDPVIRTGDDAKDFSPSVKIERSDGSEFICGGTIVWPNFVVTAAECLIKQYSAEQWVGPESKLAYYENGSAFRVSAGEVTYDPDDEKEFKQTRKGSIVTHSVSWNWFNAGYNIGGLYLEKNITYENNFKTGAYIRGASMCDWDYDETYGEKIDKDATYYVTGWGDPTVEPRSISLLSYLEAELVDDETCYKEMKKQTKFLPPKMKRTTVCLKTLHPSIPQLATTCYLDTGSGVYQRGKAFGPCLWGVVNHCFPCDSPYTLVTRVAPFKQFLGVEQPKYGNCDLTDLECWGYIKNATPHSEDFYQDETTAGATFFFDPIEAYTFSACVLLSMVFTRIY